MESGSARDKPSDMRAPTLGQRAYSRRDVLRGAAAGAGLLGMGVVASACSGAGGAHKSKSSSSHTSAAWAKAPVSFVLLDTTEPRTLDPSQQPEFDATLVSLNTYDRLTRVNNATHKLEPSVATSWKSNGDLTEWKFKIRSGIHFLDGSPLNADAVALSWQRHLAIGAADLYGPLLEGITSVKATAPLEVTFTTKAPQPWLPAHTSHFGIMSAQAIRQHRTNSDPWAKGWFKDHIAGSGPYELVSWVHGTKIILKKNPKWWGGPWKPGSIDNVTIQWEASASTKAQLISGGAADFSTEWDIPNALSVAKSPGFTLHKYDVGQIQPFIAFNQKKPPFDNVDVREAFQYAFDYEAMRRYYQGYAGPTTMGPLPPKDPYALKSLPLAKQDLSKAKALLRKAGVDAATFKPECISAAGYPTLVAGGTILQSSLQQIGVKIKLTSIQFGSVTEAVSKLSTSPPITSALYSGSSGELDPTQSLSEYLPGQFVTEFTQMNSPAFVAAYTAAQQGHTHAAIAAAMDKAQQAIVDQHPGIWGAAPQALIPVPDYLEGFVLQEAEAFYPVLLYQLRVHQH